MRFPAEARDEQTETILGDEWLGTQRSVTGGRSYAGSHLDDGKGPRKRPEEVASLPILECVNMKLNSTCSGRAQHETPFRSRQKPLSATARRVPG